MLEKNNIHNDETVEEEHVEEEQVHSEEVQNEETEEKINPEEPTDESAQDEKEDVRDEESTDTDEKSDDEVAKLTARIQELEAQIEEKENRLLRLQADFDNYRKRTRSEMDSFNKYKSHDLALELLNSIDNFERALQTEAQTEEGKAILEGMEMVYKSILSAFEKEGIKPIEAVGQEFDPKYHHAVMQDQNENYDSNIVTEELRKGYMIKDRVLRPSMVKVNQ